MQDTLNHLGAQFLSFAWPMLWQSSLLIAVVFAVDWVLARKLRASIRHALWLVVLVKLLLPPTLALPTSAAWWLFPAKPIIIPAAVPDPGPTTLNTSVVVYDDTPPPDFVQEPVPQIEPPRPSLNRAGWTLLATGAVSVGLLIWLLLRWWQLTQKVRRATPAETPGADLSLDLVAADVRRLKLPHHKFRVRIIDARMSPAVCGLFRPVILLPRVLVESLSAPQLRAVLLHEIIHLRRRDIWVNCAQSLLQILYWWHPLVWLANVRIRRVREEAVDDAVMLALAGEADTYAPTLLEVAKLAFQRPLMSLGIIGLISIIESRSALRQRIERLVDFQAPRKAGLTFLSFCAIFMFSAIALPMGQGPAQIVKAEQQILPPQSAPAQTPPPPAANHPLPALVSVTAAFYQLPPQALDKFTTDLNFHPADTNGDAWWSASPDEYTNLESQLTNSNFTPLSRPRVQCNNGMEAQMFIGNDIHGTDLDCRPTVNDDQIDLDLHGKITDHTSIPVTNQFTVKATSPNHGGIIVRFPNDTNNTVIFLNVKIIPAPRSASSGILTDPNFRVALRALQQRTGRETLGEPEITVDTLRKENQGEIYPPRGPIEVNPSVGAAHSKSVVATTNALREAREKIIAKLNLVCIPYVSFDHTNLAFVISQLDKATMKFDSEHPDIAASTPPIVWTYAPPFVITIPPMTNAPLSEIIKAIVQGADKPLQYIIEPFGVAFTGNKHNQNPAWSPIPANGFVPDFSQNPPDETSNSTKLLMRTFRVDPSTIRNGLENVTTDTGLSTNATPSAMARAFFSQLGVNLAFPPGKSVFFNDRLGVLFVKATKDDLDTIERALQVLNQAPPQIHLKARIYEVPRDAFFGLANNPHIANLSAGKPTGILTDPIFRTVLQTLSSRKDVKLLAEPEVAVTSGRQIQIPGPIEKDIVNDVVVKKPAETGPVLEVVPYVLADGYTINLALIPVDAIQHPGNKPSESYASAVRHIVTTVNVWDGQTVFLAGLPEQNINKSSPASDDKELQIFVTATIVDPAGARVHSDDQLPFAQTGAPAQPATTNDDSTFFGSFNSNTPPRYPIIRKKISTENHLASATAPLSTTLNNLIIDGKLLYESGRFDESRDKFNTTLALDPSNTTAKYFLNLIDTRQPNKQLGFDWYLGQFNQDSPGVVGQGGSAPSPSTTTNPLFSLPMFSGLGRQAIVAKLDKIRLDDVSYYDMPLAEVLRQLSVQCRLRDPERKGINFLIDNTPLPGLASPPSVATTPSFDFVSMNGRVAVVPSLEPDMGVGSSRIKMPSLTDVRLADVLDAIVLTSDHPLKYSIEDFAVVFSAKDTNAPEPLYTRTFRIDPNTFYRRLEGDNKVSPQNNGAVVGVVNAFNGTNGFAQNVTTNSTPSALARAYFTSLGINFLNPPGKSIFFTYKTGLFFVKATEQDLDVIEKALQALNQSPAETPITVLSGRPTTIRATEQSSSLVTQLTPHQLALLRDWKSTLVVQPTQPRFPGARPVPISQVYPAYLTENQRDTERQLMSQTLQNQSEPAPEVHIKTRFISVPKGTLVNLTKYLNATNQTDGNPMGFLSANDEKAILKYLGAQKGIMTLSEPEITMMSGRQAQLQTMETISVVTNLAFDKTANYGKGAIIPQSTSVEVGPIMDISPSTAADGFAICLTAIPSLKEFRDSNRLLFAPTNGTLSTAVVPQNFPLKFPPEFQTQQIIAHASIWDGQTLLLTGMEEHPIPNLNPTSGSPFSNTAPTYSNNKTNDLLILITPTLVDSTGTRIHSDTDLIALPPLPPQPK